MKLFLLLLLTTQILAAPSGQFKVRSRDRFGVEREYFTGYVPPTEEQKLHRNYRSFPINSGMHAFEPVPEEINYLPNVQRAFRQLAGDCWAQAGASGGENIISLIDHVSIFLSRQSIIDCSGDGSASSGGGVSMDFLVKPKGIVYEADYPYVGRDQRCKTDSLKIHQQFESEFMLKDLTLPSLQRALWETKAMEVCGASSSLRNGGVVDQNYSGREDHCYALVAILDGAKHGWKNGKYTCFINSWGGNWGGVVVDGVNYPGVGCYLYAKDGIHPDGDLINEAQGVVYKPACTPQPVANAGPDKSVLVEE